MSNRSIFPISHIIICLFKYQKSEDFQKSHIVMLCLLKLFIITIEICLFTSNYRKVQGAVASWLVPLSPDRVVGARALA